MLTTIHIDKRPFLVGDKTIAMIAVNPIGFLSFVKAIEEANRLGMDKENALAVTRRTRIKMQAKFLALDGTEVSVDHMALSQMPRSYAKKLIDALDAHGGPEGKLLNEGEGIAESALYQLGTPIKVIGGENNGDIKELEFSADTFGDVEDVLAETNQLDQTVALLKKVAKPAGNTTLIALPSWALEAITIQDGFTIMEKILPRFLE